MEPNDTSRHSGDFELVFDEAPVGLWEQDMSEARRYVKNLKNRIDGDLEQHLHEHPEKLREIASRIKTLSVNQRLLDMLGARNRDHLLQNLNNIFSKRTYDTFCDEVVSFIEEGQTSYRSEIDVKTLGGEERTVLFDLNARNDDWSRVIVSYRDITDRKKTQEKLEQSEQRLRQLAENIDSIFWMLDLEKRENLYVSPACESITGRPREFFENDMKGFLEIVHPEDRERVQSAFQRGLEHNFEDSGKYNLEYRIVRPDGSIRWLYDQAFPVENDRERPDRVAGLAEDITERKRAEQQLKTSLKEKKTLLEEIHHRVKNNMQIVSSLLSLHGRKVEDPEVRKYFEDCQERIRSMMMIHEKLYDSDSVTSLNFREYVEELIESLFASYTTSTRPDVSLDVAEDPDLPLDQLIGCGIMINELVANALEHGFDDTTLTPELALSFEQIGDDFRLILRDNGRGLPESFDPGRHGNLGWELLESLVQYQLQGEYEITNRDGLEVVVTFPRSVDPNL